jgi:hypothetical protein
MDATMDALQYRLSPTALIEELWSSVSSRTGGGLGGAVEILRANPVPAGLIGAGLAFLVMSERRAGAPADARQTAGTARVAGADITQRVGEGAGAARSSVERVAKKGTAGGRAATSKASSVAGSAAREAAAAADAARERVAGIGRSVGAGAERAGRRTGELLHEQPLVLAGLGLALGAALGAAVPRSHKEDQLMGQASDDLIERATELGREALAAAEEATRAAVDAGSSQVRQEVSRAEDKVDVEAAAEHVRDKVEQTTEEADEAARRVGQAIRTAAAERARPWPEKREERGDEEEHPPHDLR